MKVKIGLWIIVVIGVVFAIWGMTELKSIYRSLDIKVQFQENILELYRRGASEERIAEAETALNSFFQKRDPIGSPLLPVVALVLGCAAVLQVGPKLRPRKNDRHTLVQ